ncbi:hypothetical protein Mal64_10070 [Pseudobythopirellula maris]|uniref:Uncharacterized protein n=1 Tax=Pseudobythopirellula maris TaxID=2527991 RepID=A0A5C5ZWH6_9BACT|nr:hypothetical protein Mal64_10070 [Pseudobythopirellula maris]
MNADAVGCMEYTLLGRSTDGAFQAPYLLEASQERMELGFGICGVNRIAKLDVSIQKVSLNEL